MPLCSVFFELACANLWQTVIVIAGNKCDLLENEAVKYDEALNYAKVLSISERICLIPFEPL